jgi:hypothetical protein
MRDYRETLDAIRRVRAVMGRPTMDSMGGDRLALKVANEQWERLADAMQIAENATRNLMRLQEPVLKARA